MQLCSQEWLTALERHAGVSFTKLLREGRHVASSTDEVRLYFRFHFRLRSYRPTFTFVIVASPSCHFLRDMIFAVRKPEPVSFCTELHSGMSINNWSSLSLTSLSLVLGETSAVVRERCSRSYRWAHCPTCGGRSFWPWADNTSSSTNTRYVASPRATNIVIL